MSIILDIFSNSDILLIMESAENTENTENMQTRIVKNSSTDLVIGFGEFKGHKYVELREYSTYNNDVDGGVPTKKGVTVKFGDLDEVIKALQACSDKVNSGGAF